MKIGMICFTARGTAICRLLCRRFRDTGTESTGYVPRRFWKPEWEAEGIRPQDKSLSEWTGSMFEEKRALVFIGAAGIAVRAIAPFVRDKMTDPRWWRLTKPGIFVSPCCQAMWGANELAERMADWLQGIPVITTATDVNGVFAVDVFAVRSGLCITDRKEAKRNFCLAAGWRKGGIFLRSGVPRGGEGVWIRALKNRSSGRETENVGYGTEDICRHNICRNSVCRHNIWITFRNSERPTLSPDKEAVFLRLVPKVVVVGVGCRKELRRISWKAVS